MCATFRSHYPDNTRRVEQDIFLSMQCHRLISYHSDCCRSQALNLSIRPVYLGGKASPAVAPKPSPKKPVKTYHKKKPVHKKPASKIGIVCIPACQTLCKPVCKWVVYLLYAWIYILGKKKTENDWESEKESWNGTKIYFNSLL